MEADNTRETEKSSKSDYTKNADFMKKYPDSLSEAKDGNPPKFIYDAFVQYSPKFASEEMNLLIHLSMIENGFKLCTGDGSTSLPTSWRDIATTLKYSWPSHLLEKSGAQKHTEFTCSIVAVTMGSTKQVLASFVGQDSEISVKFDMNQYTSGSSLEPEKLKKLSNFDFHFRNELLYPLRISAHNILGLPAPWHLMGLPYDIMILVLKLLPTKDILNLRLTCTSIKDIVDNQIVWYNLFKRDFHSELQSAESVTSCLWKDRYKTSYIKQKSLQAKAKREQEHILYENPFHHPRNPHGIGVLGVPGAYFDPPAANPYGPMADIYPLGGQFVDPFGDPDSPYFGGELAPNRRGPRLRGGHFPQGYGPPARSGGPRIHFL